jgi:long-subunit fatty acid transport protein
MKSLFAAIVFLCVTFAAFAQKEYEEGSSGFFDRVYLGGNFGAQFGTVTFVDLSPLAGYMITPKLSAGVGVTYQYINYKYYNSSYSNYGWRTFVRRNVGRQLFVHGEFENLNLQFYDVNNDLVRQWVPGLFVGGGLFQPIGRGGGGFMISALYNLLYDQNRSPYYSPIVLRVGFTF